MALETVRVYAIDESSSPLIGVRVRAYDGLGALVTENVTVLVGLEAYCELMLDGSDPPTAYTIRLSKTSVSFDGSLGADSATPQSISIYSPPTLSPTGTNYFQVQGQTYSIPVATDPRLCRCSAIMVDQSNQPVEGISLHLSPASWSSDETCRDPLIVDDRGVVGGKLLLRSDADGLILTDLFRDAEYWAVLEGFMDSPRHVTVPDLSSVNLMHLLFPVVHEVGFSPDPVAVMAGAYVDVTLTIRSTDGRDLDPDDLDVRFASDDEAVATAGVVDGALRVTGVGVGSTTITATRVDLSIVTVPEEPTLYTPLAVTVS